MKKTAWWMVAVAVGAMLPATAAGQSSFLAPAYPGYGDIWLAGGLHQVSGGFDVLSDGRIVAQVTDWNAGRTDVNLYAADGQLLRTLTNWTDAGYGSFVRVDPDETTVWFGKANEGPDDVIRTVPLAAQDGEYTQVAQMTGNLDLQFASFGGVPVPLVVGRGQVGEEGKHGIWRLDATGADEHRLLLETPGASAGFAVSQDGTLYAGTYEFTGQSRLLGAAAEQWQPVLSGDRGYLTADEAAVVVVVPGGFAGVSVDDASNVVFGFNEWEVGSSLAVLAAGEGAGLEVVATGAGMWGNWFSAVVARGDVTAGGRAYVADFYSTPIAYVPEPATMALLAAGMLLTLRRRRR